ncbi:toprim domain-containing protein [Candidatus Microgenomates bacterium]|nr:MAG: toprim domain-containing protein [Candidatus Microgenomates bacterium]
MNILSYLDSKGINYKLASGGLEATFPCPVCGKTNKFYVNTETGAFICFRGSCDTHGGLKDLINLLGDKETEIDIKVSEKPREIQEPEPIDSETIEEYHRILLERYSSFKEYFEGKRGYTIETVKQFKLGWGNGAVLIPIFDEKGNCVNFKHKPDPTRPNPAKGMYSITGRGRNRLFNIAALMGEQKPQEVIIAEGEWDCMRLTQEGYIAVSATVGTGNFKPEWIPLFQGVSKIYICQDNDENQAGQNGAKRIAKMFLDQKITTYIVNLPNPKKGIEEKVDVTDFFVRLGKTKEYFDLLLQTAQPFVEEEKEEDGKRLVDYLCELAIGAGIIVFLDQSEEPYLILPEQPLVAYPIYGGKLRGWLSSLYMEVSGKSFSGDTYKEVADYLYAKAVHEGKTLKLWNRVAMIDDVVYYDLGDGRKAVKIDKTGWEITHKAPVRFKRFTHQLSQVEPIEGELVEVLEFVNLKNEPDKILYLTYLVAGLNPIIPRALLTLFGDQGSAKSTAFRITRSIIDPSNAGTHHPSKAGNLLSPPKDEADLANKTLRHYCLYFDNLSYCPDWMSDAFARIVTGSSYSKRKLYTDTDEITINAMPLLGMNGINLVAEKPDLLDRLLILEMERIPEEVRKTEREFWDSFRKALPRILGGLFTALSRTLELVENLKLGHLPRMADYATFATAAAIALGSSQEEFLSAFNQNIKKQNQSAIDSSAVAQVILQFMEDKNEWEGSSSQLHKDLLKLAEDSNLKIGGSSGFPKASNWLWKKIQIVRPNLNNFGIKAEHGEDKASSTIKLTKFSKDRENTSDTSSIAILDTEEDGSIDGSKPNDVADAATLFESEVAGKEVVATIPRLWDESPDN